MLSWWAVALVLPAVLVALDDWRNGLFALLFVAFLQDPARKLESDMPVYFTLLVGVVFTAAYLSAQTRIRFVPTQIRGWNHYLRIPFTLFLLLVAAQAVNSLVQIGNPIIVGIGALSYLAPLPAMLAGYHFAVKGGRAGIERWLTWYLIGALIMLPGLVLEYAGIDWQVLGDVGKGLQMFQDDAILTAHSGFFRASEIAAWHCATAVCVLLMLSSIRRVSTGRMIIVIGIIVALLAIGVLTGRRKIFVEIVIFLSIYVALFARFGKGAGKLAVAALLGGLLSYGAVTWWAEERPSDDVRYHSYAERSATVGNDISDRFVDLGLEPVLWAIDGFGWLGGGLGVGSQGAQHFGGGAAVYGGAAEGGLGKVTAELGVPGLLIALWLAGAAVRYGWQVLVFVSRRSSAIGRLAYGLAAFLIANLAVFFVATQVFGDLFVLLLLGLVTGFFLATPALAEGEQVQRGAARGPVPSSGSTVLPGANVAQRAQRP